MEKQIEQKLKKRVESLGGLAVKFPPLFYAGFPDRLLFFPFGRLVLVETKDKGKAPRPLQRVVHDKLRGLGFRVEVVDSEQDIDRVCEIGLKTK